MEEFKAHLLLIDDEESFCIVNTNILKLAGYHSTYVLNAEDGVEYIKTHRDIDVILLDIDLGEGMNGTEALPAILDVDPALQIIMITSNREISIGVDCMKKGAYDYLTKPFHRPHLEKTIAAAIERKKIVQLKNLYLEILVHDLKNPVQNISMGLDALDSEEELLRKKAFHLAQYGCRQIQSMVNNILRITQFEKASPTLDITEVILNEEEITKEIRSCKEQIEFTGKKFNMVLKDAREYTIKTEKSLFYQTINNLLTNAIRFTRKGDTISLELEKKDPKTLVTTVTNTGSFIEQEMREAVFDKFFKPKFYGKHQGRNFGLGLTFCKYAVRSLGGGIRVESRQAPPVTSFIFTITTAD